MTVRKLTRYLLMLVSLASVHARMQAQTAVDGAIGGTVEDKTGAVISGANIVIHNNGTNAEQNITSDAAGFFRANHLQPGTYTVTVSAPNFDPEPRMPTSDRDREAQSVGWRSGVSIRSREFAGD